MLSRQSTLTPPHFLRLSWISGLCIFCFLFTYSLFFVTWVYKFNSFAIPVYNDVLGPAAACPVIMKISSSFIEDQWVALSWHFHPGGVVDIYTIPILVIFMFGHPQYSGLMLLMRGYRYALQHTEICNISMIFICVHRLSLLPIVYFLWSSLFTRKQRFA